MGRRGPTAKVRWNRKNGGGFFMRHEGRVVALAMGPDDAPKGPVYGAALEAMKRLLEGKGGSADRQTVQGVADARKAYLESGNKTSALNNHRYYVGPFAASYGKLQVSELRPFHVREWLARQTTWHASSKRLAVKLVVGLFNWAARDGQIDASPIKGRVDLPKDNPRGAECRLDPTLADLLIAHAPEHFRHVLRMLQGTGARPEEIEMAEGWHYEGGRFRFSWNATRGHIHKTAKRGRRVDRIIHMDDELASLVERQMARHKTGPVFRDSEGKPWTKETRANEWAKLLRHPQIKAHMADMGIERRNVVPYSFRHSFISEFIDAGLSASVCAELVGTSLSMIERVYGHPDQSRMRDYYMRFRAGQ